MKHSVEMVELKNGGKGLLINVPDSSVMNFDFNFRAGDYLSPKGKWDTAHVMEHMLFGANERYRKSSNFSKEFSKNGAYSNALTETYQMSYVAECADFEAERILDLLCLGLESPLFLENEFNAEKANVREELKGLKNNHFGELSLKICETMGQYDLTIGDRIRQLDSIRITDVKNHYHKTHTTPNMRFMIGGNITKHRDAIIERIESIKLVKDGNRIPLPNENIINVVKPICLKNKTVENIYYRWENATPRLLDDKEEFAVDVLFGMLLDTLHSRIFGKAREQGLAYHIAHGRYRISNRHIWWIGGQVIPTNIQPLFELIKKVLVDVSNGLFSDEEMVATKQYALGNFQRGFQTVSQLLSAYGDQFVYNDQIEKFFEIPKRIDNLSSIDIINAARICLNEIRPSVLGFMARLTILNQQH